MKRKSIRYTVPRDVEPWLRRTSTRLGMSETDLITEAICDYILEHDEIHLKLVGDIDKF